MTEVWVIILSGDPASDPLVSVHATFASAKTEIINNIPVGSHNLRKAQALTENNFSKPIHVGVNDHVWIEKHEVK